MLAKLLDLADLEAQDMGLKPSRGLVQAEAAAVCLEDQGHAERVALAVEPCHNGPYELVRGTVTELDRRTYADRSAATKEGAEGVARLLVRALFDLVLTGASDRGTGIDYWLGGDADDTDLFGRGRKRLEVSGIRHGDAAEVRRRVKEKRDQVAPSHATGLDAIVVVVEFSAPRAVVEEVIQ